MTGDASKRRRFDIALSFPGEHRDVVEPIAKLLDDESGHELVLYDHYHKAEFARPDLDVYLPELYRSESELLVLFLCPEYAEKRWCNLEWRHIRQLIATADAERIMFLSIGDPGDLSQIGILSGDGFIDISELDSTEVVAEVFTRLRINRREDGNGDSHDAPKTLADISRIDKYAPVELIGREDETRLLNDSCEQMQNGNADRPLVLTFVALGGEGKTSLVSDWVRAMDRREWPGCESVFAWSFYSQGSREQVAVSSDLFLAEALRFFGDAEMADSAQGAFEKGKRLAELVGGRKAVLVLDGLEPLQYPPNSPTPGKLKDNGIESLLTGLARHRQGLCVVTTRFEVADLKSRPDTAPQLKLLRLPTEAGVALLQSIGVKGSLRPGSGISFNAEPPGDGKTDAKPSGAVPTMCCC